MSLSCYKTDNAAYDATRDLCEDAKIIYATDFAMYNKYLLPGIDTGSYIRGFVGKGETKNILNRAFTETSKLLIKNLRTNTLFFGLSPDEVSPVDTLTLVVGEEREVFVTELGDIGYHHNNVTNKDTLAKGEYSIKIL